MRANSRPSRIARWFISLIAALFALVVLYTTFQIWRNNRSVDVPSAQSISRSLEKSIDWLVQNRETILGQNSAMLWWFVKESAGITRDERLNAILAEYMRRHIDPYPENAWRYLFDGQSKIQVAMWQLEHLPDYNLYFIYGASCNPELAKEEVIRRQNDPAFCATHHPFSPACVTHQLIGARLAQRRNCLDQRAAQELVPALQEKIVNQLVWDPRVMDVYIQRVLVLAESGAGQQIKPVWLQRILEAQLPDGSWSGFYPLIPVGRGYHAGFSGNKLAIK